MEIIQTINQQQQYPFGFNAREMILKGLMSKQLNRVILKEIKAAERLPFCFWLSL